MFEATDGFAAKGKGKGSAISFVVTDPKEGSDKKAVWREVGAVWPAENGNGFHVVIHPQISVSGRIICTIRKDKPAEAATE